MDLFSKLPYSKNEVGEVLWEAPSNIALVKYWGKKGNQIPANPSISMTLNHATTRMKLKWGPKEVKDTDIQLDFFFEGFPNLSFEKKIKTFLKGLSCYLPFLTSYKLKLESSNSFPHSTGIASSASSMAALSLCLMSMGCKACGIGEEGSDFYKYASFIARLGSGSAARSLFPEFSVWGETNSFTGSNNEWGIPFNDFHKIYDNLQDSILIISSETKEMSSRAGHELMVGNPYADCRYKVARQHLSFLKETLKSGDIEEFGKIVEREALELHALMSTSDPSYLLMRPETVHLIKLIRHFRSSTSIPVFFTLDAGPNIHLIYPEKWREKVTKFIEEEASIFLENDLWIPDHMGKGPIRG